MKKDLSDIINRHAEKLLWLIGVLVGILFTLITIHFLFYSSTVSSVILDTTKFFIVPLIALIAALITFLAFHAQITANKKIQDQFNIQQFESQFFEMLRLHKENVNEMKIAGYGRLLSYKFDGSKKMNLKSFKKAKEIDLTQYVRYIENRKVFYNMNVELIACIKLVMFRYKIIKYYNSISKSEEEEETLKRYFNLITLSSDDNNEIRYSIEEELTSFDTLLKYDSSYSSPSNKFNTIVLSKEEKGELLKLSYNIFFFGVKSELIKCDDAIINTKDLEKIKEYLKQIRNKHKETFGDENKIAISQKDEAKIYIKYKPFSGHENRLGHYFRHLYTTVKYVVENEEKKKLFGYDKSRAYLKLLRSQLSNDEFLLLYYNFLYGSYGKNWDSKESSIENNQSEGLTKGEKNQFFTKYRMLHNIPLSRVYPKSMSPENIFEKYNDELSLKEVIENHKIDKYDNLFEWDKKN